MTRLNGIDAHEPSATVHYDWLTAVLPVPSRGERMGLRVKTWAMNQFKKLGVNFEVWNPMKHGLYTYANAQVTARDSIIFAWTEDDQEGSIADCMLQMSGAGVESLESVLANQGLTLAGFIKRFCDDLDGHFSRVDACANFFNYPKEYSARFVGEQALAGNLITRSSSIRVVRRASSRGGKDTDDAYLGTAEGYTLYVGKSPKQLRVYNKLAERSDKINVRYKLDSWSRWEFQLNGDHAQQFIDEYLNRDCDLPSTWTGFLAGSYRFIERVGEQKKRSRYPTATWFEKIIDNSVDFRTRIERQMPTFERSEKWLSTQVSNTLATVFLTRYKKYLLNGVSEADARKLAINKVMKDIDYRINNDDVNLSTVEAWLKERGIE